MFRVSLAAMAYLWAGIFSIFPFTYVKWLVSAPQGYRSTLRGKPEQGSAIGVTQQYVEANIPGRIRTQRDELDLPSVVMRAPFRNRQLHQKKLL